MSGPIVAIEGVTKTYPGATALANVSFDVVPGEVHAVVGENGAGKSTLIRILSGDCTADTGTMRVSGTPVVFTTPSAARERGIATIFQELAIVPWLSVAENIVLGSEPTFGPAGLIYSRRMANSAAGRVGEAECCLATAGPGIRNHW